MSFYGGGRGPRSLLRLSELNAALRQLGLALEPEAWVLRPQELGLSLSASGPVSSQRIRALLESLPGVKQIGSLLDARRLCVVVELEDMVWGHWGRGFKIFGEGAHRHELAVCVIELGL